MASHGTAQTGFKGFALTIYIVIATLAGAAHAQSDPTPTISIPIPKDGKGVKKPASDVIVNGQVMAPGTLAGMIETGFDSSVDDPSPNKFWQNKVYPASDAATRGYPDAATGVKFVAEEGENAGQNILFRVQDATGKQFRLVVSEFSQPMMMRSALLRKLGFFVASPQYYSNLKINFASKSERDDFITTVESSLALSLEAHNWILKKDDTSVTLASSTLETLTVDSMDLYWGLAPDPKDPTGKGPAMLELLSRSRSFRSLLLPYSIVDVPLSINRYSVKMVSVVKGFAVFTYPMAGSFAATDYDDVRWILRKMAMLSMNDWTEVVANSNYPADVQPLVLAKMINRLNSALEAFQLPTQFVDPDISQISSASGTVKNGKVLVEYFPGTPQRLSNPVDTSKDSLDARQSPYQDGDFQRYLAIFGGSSVLESAIGQLNNKLQVLTTADAVDAYKSSLMNKLIDHFVNHPNDPMVQKVTSWGGPLLGANIDASRHVATGTYSGSTAPVQLVDDISIGVSVGYFRALDGLKSWIPAAGGNLALVRDYTHVRPILSMKEGTKQDWDQILVPKFMNGLAQDLKGKPVKDNTGVEIDPFDNFYNNLRDGEVFTITDSIALSGYLQASAVLDVLLGLTPFDFMNSVTLGADANRVILRQTQIVRVGQSLQVFVREMKNRGQGLEFGVNFFLELLKLRAQSSNTDILTNAFILKYDPASVDTSDQKTVDYRTNLRLTMMALLKNNNTDLLYDNFQDKKFVIQHELNTKETKGKFLAWRFGSFTEDHTLKIDYPMDPNHPEIKPSDQEVVLFASKKGEIVGRDLLSLGYDVLDGILSFLKVKDVTLSRSLGDNPADVPLGRAHWKMVDTEADLTTFQKPYDSVSMIDYVWGGWSMKKDSFLKVVADIQNKFSSVTIAGFKLIDPQEFNNVDKLDFYRINAHVTLTASGVSMVRDLILQPTVAADSKNPRKAKDWAFFNALVKMMGDGDLQKGYDAYLKTCYNETSLQRQANGGVQSNNPFRGNDYGCMANSLYQLLQMAAKYPTDKASQTQWTTKAVYILESITPIASILKFLGEKNYIAFVNINGFMSGDEDGDLQYFSNIMGDPETNDPQAAGLINMYIRKTGILPTELDRTQGSYQ